MSRVLAALLVATTLAPAKAALVDFNLSDGGFISSTAIAGGTPWTYTTGALCAGGSGGCWSVPDYTAVSDQLLTTLVYIATGPTAISFDHTFNLEGFPGVPAFFDGGVVEISVNGGAYADVTTLGAFSGQAYVGTIFGNSNSPIANRPAFSATNSAGFGTYASTSITLGLTNGDQFQLRWRMATDQSDEATPPNGWFLDNVNINANLAAVPEPATTGLTLLGLAALACRFRRKK